MFEQSVDERLLRLIEEIAVGVEEIRDFYLAGGTALSLYLGHRKSVDLDFFCEKEFDAIYIQKKVLKIPGSTSLKCERRTLKMFMRGVSLTFFHYPYPLLEECKLWRNIYLASLEDILCMKIIAISQRAEKKDFFDIFELMKLFSPIQAKSMLFRKYGKDHVNCHHILKSIFFFDDAESSPDPISLNGTTWEQVKDGLKKMEKQLCEELIS